MAPSRLLRHRFSADEYDRLVEAGILGPDNRVELISGEIFARPTMSSRRAACVCKLHSLLGPSGALVRIQQPLRLDDRSEPEPALVLLHRRDDYYAAGHPGPAEVLLVVEIADVSSPAHFGAKLPLYAASGVAEVWLVDLHTEKLLVHLDPSTNGYRHVTEHVQGDLVSPAAFPDLRLAIAEILV